MFGAVLVFFSVCVLVALYMRIVHSFLQASERSDIDDLRPVRDSAEKTADAHEIPRHSREQWAH